jgi:NADH:ubiquinone oxidoreductase subunit 3 (subunit A)
MYIEYKYIFSYFFFFIIIGFLLFFISFLLVYQKPNNEKQSAYECGFNPFGDARAKFEVRYYLIAILFIIFDLELLFLFPWVICLNYLNWFGIYSMIFFLFILTLGFIYEWFYGALDWK